MPEKLRVHLPILNSSEEFHTTEENLHGPQVWCNWKQLYRFFPTILITCTIFLNTEINESTVPCMKVGSATNRLFFPCLLNSVL